MAFPYNLLLGLSISIPLALHADIDYRVVNSTGYTVTAQAPAYPSIIEILPGRISTVSTPGGDCINSVKMLKKDGTLLSQPQEMLHRSACAGTIICIYDNGSGPEAVPMWYNGAASDSECTGYAPHSRSISKEQWQ